MKRMIPALLLLLLSGAVALAQDEAKPEPKSVAAGEGIQFSHDYVKAREAAKAEGKKLFVVFSTSWCGPCKRLEEKVWSDKSVAERVSKDFVAVKLDGDKETDLKKQFEITAYPTLIIAEADGKVLVKAVGAPFATPEAAIVWFDTQLKTPGLLDTLIEATKKNPLDPMAHKALADAYFKAGRKEDAAKSYAVAEKLLEDALIDVKLRQCEALIAKRDAEPVREVLDEWLPRMLKRKDERAIQPSLTFANLIARLIPKKDPAKARELVVALVTAFPDHKRHLEFECNAAYYAYLSGDKETARKEAAAIYDNGDKTDVWVDRARRLIEAIDKDQDLSGKPVR